LGTKVDLHYRQERKPEKCSCGKTVEYPGVPEHINVVCKTCGHNWDMKPAS